jgi:hypothetical protein
MNCKFLKYSIVALTVFLANNSYAQDLKGPCDILSNIVEIETNLRKLYPSKKILSFIRKISSECNLQKKHLSNLAASEELGVDLEKISAYQALRYIKQIDYINAAKQKIPVPFIYQLKREHYRSMSTRTDEVWTNWMMGISQLDSYVEKTAAGQPLTIDDIRAIHVGFYQHSFEVGDFSQHPRPGIFVTPEPYHKGWPWWSVRPKEASKTEEKILAINREMRRMKLLPPIDELDPKGRPYSSLLFFFKRKVWSSDTRYTTRHYTKLLNFIQSYLEINKLDYLEIPNPDFPLLTPMEFNALIQKWFVGIHGLHEGNGRTGRFLQDLVSRLFKMPYAKSGALMDDDVLTTLDEYYALFYKSTVEIVNVASACVDKEYPSLNGVITFENSKRLSYRCWLLD